MKVFGFTITINKYVEDLDAINAFYGKVDDASVAGSEGQTVIHFDREADTLDEALRSTIMEIQREGWQARTISVEPDCVMPLPAP